MEENQNLTYEHLTNDELKLLLGFNVAYLEACSDERVKNIIQLKIDYIKSLIK